MVKIYAFLLWLGLVNIALHCFSLAFTGHWDIDFSWPLFWWIFLGSILLRAAIDVLEWAKKQ